MAIMYGFEDDETGEIINGMALLFVFAVLLPGIYIRLLVKNLDELDKVEKRKKFGSLFAQLALDDQSSE